MLFTVIKKNSYQDSVNLMLLTSKLSAIEQVERISIMMGTPSNKDIFKNIGLYTSELEEAGANDICIVLECHSKDILESIINQIDSFLKNQSTITRGQSILSSRTFNGALSKLPSANMSLISINGEYAAEEAERALDAGLNVFLFSDNVSEEEELKLKKKAQEKGLIVMGPDCGTSILKGVPLGFSNVIENGNIGIVGASGTGIQEISTIIGRSGYGISHAIGTGGRDLSEYIGGITASMALELLAEDENTDVIVFVSKPPAKSVMEKIKKQFKTINKPIVTIFLGESGGKVEDNIYYATTLAEAALKAIEIANMIKELNKIKVEIENISKNSYQRSIKGLYCGGTLALEAAHIIAQHHHREVSKTHDKGVMLDLNGNEIIDLGDDYYTRSKPHPMIEPSLRSEIIRDYAMKEDTAILLFDNVIGYASNDRTAQILSEEVIKVRKELSLKNKNIIFIATVTGTNEDPQNYEKQVSILEDAGIIVFDTNAAAVNNCIEIIYMIENLSSNHIKKYDAVEKYSGAYELLNEGPRVINTGLQMFTKAIRNNCGQVIQYNWTPIASGNKRLQKILKLLK